MLKTVHQSEQLQLESDEDVDESDMQFLNTTFDEEQEKQLKGSFKEKHLLAFVRSLESAGSIAQPKTRLEEGLKEKAPKDETESDDQKSGGWFRST